MTQREKNTLLSWLQMCIDTERHYKFMFDNHLPGLFNQPITQAVVDEMSAKRVMLETICDELKIKEA